MRYFRFRQACSSSALSPAACEAWALTKTFTSRAKEFPSSHVCTGALAPEARFPITEPYYLFVRRRRGLSFPTNGEQFPPVSPQKSGHKTHTPQDPNVFVPEEALHGKKKNKKKQFPLRLLSSAQVVSYFSSYAAGLTVLNCKLLGTFGKTLGLWSRISSWSLQKPPKRLLTFKLQTD